MRETLTRLRSRVPFMEINGLIPARAGHTEHHLDAESGRTGYVLVAIVRDDQSVLTGVLMRRE